MNLPYALLCLIYLATLPLERFPGQELLKAAPILFLLAFVARSRLDMRFKKTLLPAFLFSAAGDVFLHLSWTNAFMLGLGSFLVSHLFFIATNRRLPEFRWQRLPAIIGMMVWLVLLLILVRAGADKQGLFAPVVVYGGVLATMAVTSLSAATAWTLGAGALLFMLSDSLIAWTRFVGPLPLSGYAIMVTYYAAQFLFAKGYLASGRIAA